MDYAHIVSLHYLLGSAGKDAGDYNAIAGDTGAAVMRSDWRHHNFQLIIDAGGAAGAVVAIQMTAIPEEHDRDEEDWVTIATLNDAAPYAMFSNVLLPHVRAKRTGGSTTAIKVVVSSCNNKIE